MSHIIDSPGRTDLIAWMAAAPGRSQGMIARKLGISQPAVRNWVVGTSRPESHYRVALEALSEGAVLAAAWELAEERSKLDAALGRINAEPQVDSKGAA